MLIDIIVIKSLLKLKFFYEYGYLILFNFFNFIFDNFRSHFCVYKIKKNSYIISMISFSFTTKTRLKYEKLRIIKHLLIL